MSDELGMRTNTTKHRGEDIAYRQGVIDGKTEGYDVGYQAGFKAGRNMTELQQVQKDGEPISLLADIVRQATGFGVQDEDFIASYLLPTGPIHRAYAYLQGLGIDLAPSESAEDGGGVSDIEQLREALADAEYRLEQGNSISPPYLDRTLLDLAAAASELLALKENGQTVWWCATHGLADAQEPLPKFCWISLAQRSPAPCRMVEASLHIHREGT